MAQAKAKAPSWAAVVAETTVEHLRRVREAGYTPVYMGVCAAQAPGAWLRIGPTWFVQGVGWLVAGVGVRDWGTTMGLGELCTMTSATPTWHAAATSWCPVPNMVLPVQRDIRSRFREVGEVLASLRAEGVQCD